MQKLRQPCWNAGVLKAVTFLVLSKCKATSVLQQCGQYICVKHGLNMSFHQIKYGYPSLQICLLDVSLQSFLLLPWLLLHPCIMMSEEELVVKSYERGSIISHALAHSWKQELNCFLRSCCKHEKSHPEVTGQRTWLNFLRALGRGSTAACNTIGQHETKGKGNRKESCLFKQEANTPPQTLIIRERTFVQKGQRQNTSYGRSRVCGMFPFTQAFNPHHKILWTYMSRHTPDVWKQQKQVQRWATCPYNHNHTLAVRKLAALASSNN